MKVYLASPLGFAASTRSFLAELVATLSPVAEIINPWDDHRFDEDIARAARLDSRLERLQILTRVNFALGQANEERIRTADALAAVLDGVDVDSGTAAEIGFAYALGKPIFGLRTDFRLAGDNEAALVNLQVQYFIEASGGKIVTSVPELVTALRSLRGAGFPPPQG
ncbi:MAG: 2-deoxyribonucleoside glycosidase [Chloroflexota bacterium]